MAPRLQLDLLVRENQADYGLDHLLLYNRLHLLEATHYAPLFALEAKTLRFTFIGFLFEPLNHREQGLNYLYTFKGKTEVFIDKFKLSALGSLLESVELFFHLLLHTICPHLKL